MGALELFDKFDTDLTHRENWEQRLGVFYQMRNHGLRRRAKPGKWASDVHVPLCDTLITNIKPFYVQQLFALDTLASFASLRTQHMSSTTAAARWFDFKLKQESNLQTEVIKVIDSILVNGRGIIKTIWDPKTRRIKYVNVPPTRLIVPWNTQELHDADRICHIQVYSPEQFRRHKGFFQLSEDELNKVTGKRSRSSGDSRTEHEKRLREGVSEGRDGEIVVWECYVQEEDGWRIHTFCPMEPEIEIKASQRIPYTHNKPPFTAFAYEITEDGWYTPRGVVELAGMFEMAAKKVMDERNDALSFFNRPLFSNDGSRIQNTANLKFDPGQVLAAGIKPVQMSTPPMSFEKAFMEARELAQQRVATPDFGISSSSEVGDRRTATEINAIGNLFAQSSDLRMRIFRLSLSEMYRQSWEILLQHDKQSLNFYYQDELGEVPKEALHGEYQITPTGSADGVNKQWHFQKAVSRFQMFANDPFIDQVNLRKSVLESDDPALVRTHIVDPGVRMGEEAEAQAMEILVMNEGFPAQVSRADDHEIHVKTILDWMAKTIAEGGQLSDMQRQRLKDHIDAHIQFLNEDDGKKAKQLINEVNEFATGVMQAQEAAAAQGGGNAGMESGGFQDAGVISQQ